MSSEPKKLAVLRILQILWKHSNCDKPLTQDKISEYLENDYGIVIERKAIGRNISMLKEAGFDIANCPSGCYLVSRVLDYSELRMLIDSVLSSRCLTAGQTKEIITALSALADNDFAPRVKHVYAVDEWSKGKNNETFLNVELIDEAIERGCMIVFDYNKYGTDKKLHKTSEHTVSPYQSILQNQRYYLMGLNEKYKNMGYYRIDRITNMRIIDEPLTDIRTVDGYKRGLDYREIASALPYMFADKPQTVMFYASEYIIDQVVDWFGDNAKFSTRDGKTLVTVRASENAMEYWAMQYLNNVEIISPKSLRETIKLNVERALEKYRDRE